jgi:hypothetical protein
MASEIRVNTINNSSGLGTITISNTGAVFAGVTTITNLQVTGTTTGVVVSGVTTVSAGSTATPSISPSGDTNTGIFFPSADTIAFAEGGVEAARFDSSGRLLVGTSSAFDSANTGTSWLVGIENPSNYTAFSIKTNQANANGAYINLGKSRGTTANSKTLVNNNDELGGVYFEGADGSAMRIGANISAYVDGTPGASDLPTRLVFSTTADGASSPTERLRIDSSGRLLVGTSTSYNVGSTVGAVFQQVNTDSVVNASFSRYTNDTSGAILSLGKSRGTSAGSYTIVQNGDELGSIRFAAADGTDLVTQAAQITCAVDGTPGANDMPGRLVFSTTADGASSPTERMRIRADGSIEMGKADSGDKLAVLNAASQGVISAYATNASYAATATYVNVSRAANTAYSFIKLISGDFADTEFHLRGDGNAFADGTWSGGGADYAEYFEWSDGNPDEEDRRGISVVLDGNQIRPAVDGEDPIGVISGNPSVVGDAAWNKWSGKYLRDDYGTYILEDYEVVNDEGETVIQQRRKLNPAYDPDQEYVNREDRPEWDCVGLMGKLRIRKGQPTGSRWIKMRDISDSVEEWLVR